MLAIDLAQALRISDAATDIEDRSEMLKKAVAYSREAVDAMLGRERVFFWNEESAEVILFDGSHLFSYNADLVDREEILTMGEF